MASTDGMNFSRNLYGLTLQYAASDGSGVGANMSRTSAVNTAPESSSVSPIDAAVAASAVSGMSSRDLGTLASKAASAVVLGSHTNMSVAALGVLGDHAVTVAHLMATIPSTLGSGLDMSG